MLELTQILKLRWLKFGENWVKYIIFKLETQNFYKPNFGDFEVKCVYWVLVLFFIQIE